MNQMKLLLLDQVTQFSNDIGMKFGELNAHIWQYREER